VIEVGAEAERQPLQSPADVRLTWLIRGSGQTLLAAAQAWQAPAGAGHIYTLGETSVIRQVRQHLIAKGRPKETIFAEGYWRPGRIGGHDHVDD
ncbi:MAG TPA: SIP domain-containing protein, partial [Phenylobacterium sp.]